MTIGNRIKKLRIENKLSNKELGKIMGLSKQTLRRFEKGIRKKIPVKNLIKAADYFEVKMDYLLGLYNPNPIIKIKLEDKEMQEKFNKLAIDKQITCDDLDLILDTASAYIRSMKGGEINDSVSV